MRLLAIATSSLALVSCLAAEDGHPTAPPAPAPATAAAPAPGSELKASMKEIELKIKAIKEQLVSTDADLGKLKAAADEATKQFNLALDAKLKANPDYAALKQQQDELRQKREAENKEREGRK